jgi:hypothetical protein
MITWKWISLTRYHIPAVQPCSATRPHYLSSVIQSWTETSRRWKNNRLWIFSCDHSCLGQVGIVFLKKSNYFFTNYVEHIQEVLLECALRFDQQYNRHRVSVSKTEEQIKAHFKGLVAYFVINLNLTWESFVFFCCLIQRKLCFMFCKLDLN